MDVLLEKKGRTENDFHIGLEEREVGNDIVQVNFHPRSLKMSLPYLVTARCEIESITRKPGAEAAALSFEVNLQGKGALCRSFAHHGSHSYSWMFP